MLSSALQIIWPMHLPNLKLLRPTVYEKMDLQESKLYDLDLGVKVTQNVAQYHPHHVTYAPVNFEVAMSNGSGEDSFTRKYIIWPWGIWPWPQDQSHMKCCLVPSTSCDLCTGKIWSCYFQNIMRRCVFKKIHYLTFDLDLGVKVTQNIAQYPWHHVTYAQTKFEVAASKSLWGDAFTRKCIIWPWPWGQGHTKSHPVPSTSCDLCTYKVWSCYVQPFRRRYNYKKRDGQTDRRTDRRTDGGTDDGPTLVRN